MSLPAWWLAAAQPSAAPAAGLWQALAAALDLAQSRPARAEGVVVRELRDRAGPYYVLKQPEAGAYVRLSPREYWVWQRLDGTTTLQELVVAYFLEHGTFAFALIRGLVHHLYHKRMLREQPQAVFADVAEALARRTLAHKLAWPARALLTRELVIGGLDALVTRLHHAAGWLVFSPAAQIVYLLVSVAGLYLFTRMLGDARFSPLGASVPASAVALWAAAGALLIVHELGHALTTKHYGREVRRGGLRLYFGVPAAFVDTSDIWLEGRRARMAVTWAGPYTGFILGGLAALLLWLRPDLAAAPLLFQIAALGFAASIVNLNPLLNLDGYYLLSDALEIPNLRERSLSFLRHRLIRKVARRERFSREERIFVVFGTLAALWAAYVIYAAVVVWNARVLESVQALLGGSGGLPTLIVSAALVLLFLFFLLFLGVQLFQWGRAFAPRLRRARVFGSPKTLALILGLGSAALATVLRFVPPAAGVWLTLVLGAATLAWGVRLALHTARAMRGAIYSRTWLMAAVALTLLAAAHLLWSSPLPAAADAARALDLSAFALEGLALILGWPLFAGLRGSWRAASVILLGLGWACLPVAALSPGWNLSLHGLAALWLCGGLWHWHALRLPPLAPDPSIAHPLTTRERLWDAFELLAEAVLDQLRLAYGPGSARRVRARFNRAAGARGWGFAFDDDAQIRSDDFSRPATEVATTRPVADFAEMLAAALDSLLDGVVREGGDEFARRALARGYDALEWSQREIAGEHILRQVHRAAGLAEQFAQMQTGVVALLERAPLFIAFTPGELRAVAERLRAQNFAQGEAILRQGEPGDQFFILRRGRVAVIQRDAEGVEQIVNELVSGDYFGEAALLTREPRNATIRALTPVEALALNRRDFDRLLRAGFRAHDKMDAMLRRVRLLRRIPLFADFESFELRLLAAWLEDAAADTGEVVCAQGEPGDRFYIVEAGEVAVSLRLPNGEVIEQRRLGEGEYFGEIALLMDVPRTATVTATRPTRLLALAAGPFNELVRESRSLRRALERAVTRRLLMNREVVDRSLAESTP
jgi:putative peptide zinc metalloprotease protein